MWEAYFSPRGKLGTRYFDKIENPCSVRMLLAVCDDRYARNAAAFGFFEVATKAAG